jgi:hypothetical protein
MAFAQERSIDSRRLLTRWERRYVLRFEGEIQAAREVEALSRAQADLLLEALKPLHRLLLNQRA